MSLPAPDFKTDNNVYASGKENVHGVCMSMSAHWARQCLLKGTLPADLSTNPLATAAVFVKHNRDHVAFDTASTAGFADRVIVWHQRFFEACNLDGKLVNQGTAFSKEMIRKVRNNGNGAYVFTIYGSGGHTMGFWRGDKRKAFFDPNFGQYSETTGSSMAGDIVTLLKTTYTQLQREWFLFKVTAS